MRSITRNIVTEYPTRGLEPRPLEAFFLKTSHTSLSENFRICLVLRNTGFERETEKSYRQNFYKSQKCVILSVSEMTTKLSVGFV